MSMDNNLRVERTSSLFFKYYFPTLISLVTSSVHHILNGIMLGQFVGKEGLAAVGLFAPIQLFFIALTLAVMIGGGILVSKNIGAQKPENALEIFRCSTTWVLLFGSAIAISSPFITGPLTGLLVDKTNIILYGYTYDYIFWAFLWMPLFFLRMVWGNFANNDNAPKISRNASLISVTINVILDFVLVGAFSLGTAGASIATGISILSSVLLLFLHFNKARGSLHFTNFRFQIRYGSWRDLIALGLPSFISEISFSFGLLVIAKSIQPYGTSAISAFGMINHVSFLFLRLFTAAMISFLPIASFNIGAKAYTKVRDVLTFSLIFTFLLGISVASLAYLFPDFFVNVFTSHENVQYKALAAQGLFLYFLLFIAAGPNFILGAYFQSIGKLSMSIGINVLKNCFLIIPLVYILTERCGLGLNGIWLSRSLAEILALFAVGAFTLFQREQYYGDYAIVKKNK